MGASGTDGCAPYSSWYCVTDPFHPGGDPDGDGCRRCAGLLTQCADTGKEPTLYKIKSFGHFNFPYMPEKEDPAIDRPVTPEARRGLFLMYPRLASAFMCSFAAVCDTSAAVSSSLPQVRARELYMMKEIYANGPIMACIYDYDNWNDFFNLCVCSHVACGGAIIPTLAS